MRLLGSARCVKAFQKQKGTSKLIMAGVQNTRAGVVTEEKEAEAVGRSQNMLSI